MEVKSIIEQIDWKWINAITSQSIETVYNKGPNDWCTEIDLAIERHLMSVIERIDPSSSVVSEEAYEAEAKALAEMSISSGTHLKWFVDPLDGTYNLTLGLPYFGVQLCCWDMCTDRPLLGLIYIPKLGELIAWDQHMEKALFQIWNDQDGRFCTAKPPIRDLGTSLSNSLIGFGDFSSSNRVSRSFQGRLIQSLSSVTGKIRLHGSSSIDFHFLCTGRSQAYILFTTRVWEIYPGLAVAKGFGLSYECLSINSSDYNGPLWLIAHNNIFDELKSIILSLS